MTNTLHQLSRRIRTGSVGLMFVAVQVFLPVQPVFAAPGDGTDQPVWCQYTGNVWTAQIGVSGGNQNRFPLTELPAGHSAELYIGTNGQVYAPDSSDSVLKGQLDAYCAQQYTIPVPATPGILDPCNPVGTGSNASWVVPADTEQLDWSLSATGELSVTTLSGYIFADGTTTHNFGFATDSGDICDIMVAIPAVNPVDPCGLDNASWTVPANTDQISWSLNAAGQLIATTNPGYVFTNGQTTFNYGRPYDSGALCQVPIPAPEVNDPCGLDNASWTVPANTTEITWTLVNGALIATTAANYEFTDGTTTHNYGLATDSGARCETALPTPPAPIDPCNPIGVTTNAYWELPDDTSMVTWSINDSGELIATTTADYVFPDGSTSHNYKTANDSGVQCPDIEIALPTPPVAIDPCNPLDTLSNIYWDELSYQDTETMYWELTDDGELIVHAAPGYVFANGEHSVSYGIPEDDGELCTTIVTPATPTYVDACGTDNDSYMVPDDTDAIHYVVSDMLDGTIAIIAVAQPGYVFDEDGLTEIVFTHKFDDTACPVRILDAAVTTTPRITELPQTGTTAFSFGPAMTIVAGVLTYLGVYAMQRRRSVEEI